MINTPLFHPNYFQIWCHRLPREKVYGRYETAGCAHCTNDSHSCLFPSQWYSGLFSDLSVDTPASCTLTIYVGGNLCLRISCFTFLWNRVTSVLKPNILLTQAISVFLTLTYCCHSYAINSSEEKWTQCIKFEVNVVLWRMCTLCSPVLPICINIKPNYLSCNIFWKILISNTH